MATISSILTDVKRRAGALARRLEDPHIAPTDADDPLLEQYARDGARDIALRTQRIEGRATISVTQGTFEYDVAETVHAPRAAVLKIGDADALTLDPIEGPKAREQATTRGEGQPRSYGFYGGTLWLSRKPNADGTLRLYYVAGSLIGEEDATFTSNETPGDLFDLMPPELERTIADYVLAEWYFEIGEGSHAGPLYERVERDIDRHQYNPQRPSTYTRSYRDPY